MFRRWKWRRDADNPDITHQEMTGVVPVTHVFGGRSRRGLWIVYRGKAIGPLWGPWWPIRRRRR